jgi:predicted ATPase
MITAIDLVAFKRFAHLKLDLRRLTILTGLNGSGKSTVIQALLLVRGAALHGGTRVPLTTEDGLTLGDAIDVLNVEASSNEIGVSIEADGWHRWLFDTGEAGENYVPYLRIIEEPPSVPEPLGFPGIQFTFLGAERLGPRTSHPTTPAHADEVSVGADGRFVAHALAVCDRREVVEPRRHPGAGQVTTLGAQTEAWMSDLVGPTQFEAQLVPRTSMATLRIRNPGEANEWMLPTNTGFGVSYSLPVVVAGLLAPIGGVLIIDSPEAHLHPAAQSALGAFLAVVAGSGVQVIIETHSDHVLNGIRRAVAVEQSIPADDVAVAFFGEDVEPSRLSMTEKGSINEWPPGFFDQFEADLGEITRVRRQ